MTKKPFEVKEILDITGQPITQINVTLGNETLLLYTYRFHSYDVKDVGFMKWKNGEILSFSPVPLLNGSRYVVQHGELVTVDEYGGNPKTCLFAEDTRATNWLDESIASNTLLSQSLVVVFLTVALSLIVVPLMERFLKAQLSH